MVRTFIFQELNQVDEKAMDVFCDYLSAERIEKNKRYKLARDRILNCTAYILLRYILFQSCKMTEIPEFAYTYYGKPYLKNGDVYFNLSHCMAGICVGISDHELGVDIQNITNVSYGMIKKCMAVKEQHDIQQNILGDQMFTRYWTLKEAFLKKMGIGLSVSLNEFDFSGQKEEDFFYLYEEKFSCYCEEKYYVSSCGSDYTDFHTISFKELFGNIADLKSRN